MAEPQERPPVDLGAVRHVHLVAIAGVGMAALAGMLKQRGFHVTGSDEHVYPPDWFSHVVSGWHGSFAHSLMSTQPRSPPPPRCGWRRWQTWPERRRPEPARKRSISERRTSG